MGETKNERTPLRAEVKWGCGLLLFVALLSVVGFALFMQEMRKL
jgi:hypothetical protein